MHDDERALLRACAAAPNDDLPRLVYADWLDDHSNPAKAEFIRCSVAAADQSLGAETRAANQVRSDELLATHRAAWDRPIMELGVAPLGYDPPPCVVYERGLPFGITIPITAFVANGGSIRDLSPTVTQLDMNSQFAGDEAIERLAACPFLAGITDLDLRANTLRDAGATALAASPYLTACRNLNLMSNRLTAVGVHALRDSPHFPPDMTIASDALEECPFHRFRELVVERRIGEPRGDRSR